MTAGRRLPHDTSPPPRHCGATHAPGSPSRNSSSPPGPGAPADSSGPAAGHGGPAGGGVTAVPNPLTPPMEIVVTPGGLARCVYAEAIDFAALGEASIVRASHVEPDERGRWAADLSPV